MCVCVCVYFTFCECVQCSPPTTCTQQQVHEMFGAGTAATVAPVALIKHRQGKDLVDLQIPVELGTSGALAKRVMDSIFDIQYGVRKDHPWAPVVN